MKRIYLLSAAVAVALTGCESGDIVLAPGAGAVIGGGGGGNGGGGSNPCATYSEAGQTLQGSVDTNGNCFYSTAFVSDTRPITVAQITFPNFGGLHIFADSLFIGEDVDTNAAASGVRIPQQGEGTRLVIEAGSTLVFNEPDSYVRIARGSQIFAEGTADDPITFTADEDAIQDVATESSRGLWGGIQINGNGRTNKCHDGTDTGRLGNNNGIADDPATQFAPSGVNPHSCNVTAEGRPATYGGNNNAENSGVLTYVVIKHAGFEVVDGNELNALTLNAVGSGTTINFVETYTTQDDGIELFGGAVSMDHIVAVNVGDDSIDFSEGWNGDIQYAVVVHTSGANTCVEADNTGATIPDYLTPTTKGRISNLTCVTSNIDRNLGANPSGKGDSEGPLFREGVFFELYNSIVTSNAANMASNECFEFHDTEGPQTIDAAQLNNNPAAAKGSNPLASYASSNVIACSEAAIQGLVNAANAGFTSSAWLLNNAPSAAVPANNNTNNVILTGGAIPSSSLLDGAVGPGGPRAYRTLGLITNSSGGVEFDQATQLFNVTTLPNGGFFETPTYLGGASVSDDWLDGWTVGLDLPLNP